MNRTIFYISDGTGISAKTLGHSLMTQFDQINFKSVIIPYIDTLEKAKNIIPKINESYSKDGDKPIVFTTIVKPEIRDIIAKSNGFVIDFFGTFIHQLEQELKTPATEIVGLSHALVDDIPHNFRLDAINYSLECDDGLNTQHYEKADLILIGVSRSGKTPTCLYLAMQYELKVANYPLTEEDLDSPFLPKILSQYQNKLFGLTITAERLHEIRLRRHPNSQYSTFNQCYLETKKAFNLFKREKIPYIDSTHLSIEELAAHILQLKQIKTIDHF